VPTFRKDGVQLALGPLHSPEFRCLPHFLAFGVFSERVDLKALYPLHAFRALFFLSFVSKYVVHKAMEDSQPLLEAQLSPRTLIRAVQAELQDLETSLNTLFPDTPSPASPQHSPLNSSVSSRKALEDAPISLVRRVK